MSSIKEEARRLVDTLPEDATWEDLMYEIYVRKAIDAGIADSEAGCTVSVEDVRAEYRLRSDAARSLTTLLRYENRSLQR